MAFIFVPNADGGFTEGDKQTNPDTGVEYIYSDGAWRALGSKIENEFDTLDERYLKLTGGGLTGSLEIEKSSLSFKKDDGTKQFKISPNNGDYFTNLYAYNSGGMRLRVAPNNDDNGYKTILSASFDEHIVGTATCPVTTNISWLKTPSSPHNAANKQYVDDAIKEAIADAIGSDGGSDTPAPILRPALLSWKYEGEDTGDAVTPSSGCFRLHTSNSGNKYLRFSFNSFNGCKIGDGKFSDTSVEMDYGPFGTIWEWMSGSVAKFKLKREFRVQSWRWNYQINANESRHFEFRVGSSNGHNWDTFLTNKEYFISVGGFF